MSAERLRSGTPGRAWGMARRAAFLFFTALIPGSGFAQGSRVIDTVHNLSVSGPGPIRATAETEVCKFCHVPHNALTQGTLWGQTFSDADYVTPVIRGLAGEQVVAPQPDGASRLCLSCHDGTVALGDVSSQNMPIRMRVGPRLPMTSRSNLGTDLSGSHPISIPIPESGLPTGTSSGIRARSMIEESGLRLDSTGKMQCTTCHDPHSDEYYLEGRVPRFWVRPTVAEVCIECHELN